MESDVDQTPPSSVRLRRLIRHWGLVFLIAVGFLLMALFVRETPKTVPAESLGVYGSHDGSH
jgi:hypothetical protein